MKLSIGDTTFWDNILVRKKGKKYQIAYGHHRLIALQELGVKEVDIPVRDLDNGTMIKVMANENMEDWRTSPAVLNETVLVAKEFLDAELAKYESWESTDELISSLFEDERGFRRAKGGVGRDTILKFLNGSWKGWQIQEALSTLQDDEVDRKAVEAFPTTKQAQKFKQAVKKHKIPKAKQKTLAKALAKREVSTREMAAEVAEYTTPKKTVTEPKVPPDFSTFINILTRDMASLRTRLEKAKPHLDHLGRGLIKDQFTNEGKVLLKLMTEVFPD